MRSTLPRLSSDDALRASQADMMDLSDSKSPSLESISSDHMKTKSTLPQLSNRDTLGARKVDTSVQSGRDLSTLSITSVKELHHPSSHDTLSTKHLDDSVRSNGLHPNVNIAPSEFTKPSSKLPFTSVSRATNITHDSVPQSSNLKLTKYECGVYRAVREYLDGKKLNLAALQDLRRQLSQPHICPIVPLREKCHSASLLALQKTLQDIGKEVSIPWKYAMVASAGRRAGRRAETSRGASSSTIRSEVTESEENRSVKGKGKETPTVPQDVDSPNPRAKASKGIIAQGEKKSRARARRCLSVIPEVEEPIEAGVSVEHVPSTKDKVLVEKKEKGPSLRLSIGNQPSDEETWGKYAITAESLSALMIEELDMALESAVPSRGRPGVLR